MHTLDVLTENGTYIVINHNGDYSGDVVIRGRLEVNQEPDSVVTVKVPYEALARLVAEQIRSFRISQLEQAGYETILGLCQKPNQKLK